jgi:hypothetical protein
VYSTFSWCAALHVRALQPARGNVSYYSQSIRPTESCSAKVTDLLQAGMSRVAFRAESCLTSCCNAEVKIIPQNFRKCWHLYAYAPHALPYSALFVRMNESLPAVCLRVTSL